MGDVGVYLLGAVLQQHFGGFAERARGVADVVHDQAGLALHIADHGHLGHFARFLAAFVDDRQGGVDPLGQFTRAGHTADVGADDHQLIHTVFESVLDIQRKDRGGVEVVDRNVEETLDLRGVQVHGQDPLDPAAGQHVGDHLGGDRRAGLGPAVLTGVAEVGQHRSDPRGRGPAQRIGHDHQFHQVVVRGVRRGLDDEHILAAHVLIDLDENLAVVEPFDPCIDKADIDAAMQRHAPRDGLGKRHIGIA